MWLVLIQQTSTINWYFVCYQFRIQSSINLWSKYCYSCNIFAHANFVSHQYLIIIFIDSFRLQAHGCHNNIICEYIYNFKLLLQWKKTIVLCNILLMMFEFVKFIGNIFNLNNMVYDVFCMELKMHVCINTFQRIQLVKKV